jgi:hypothetical protein
MESISYFCLGICGVFVYCFEDLNMNTSLITRQQSIQQSTQQSMQQSMQQGEKELIHQDKTTKQEVKKDPNMEEYKLAVVGGIDINDNI